MRRLMVITAFALFFTVPLCAQRGGHGGGGFHGGFGGAHAGGFGHGGFGGGHFGGMRGGGFGRGFHSSAFSRGFRSPGLSRGFRSRPFSRGPYLHDGFHRNPFRRDGFRHRFHGFGNNCWGWGCRGFGYPSGWGYYDPWLWNWWNDDYSFDQDYNRNLAIANEMDQQSLEQQRLRRQEQADGDQDSYAPERGDARSSPPASNETESVQAASPTVLVFRDQHQKEIQNYAIVGQTLWNFAAHRTEKIPLADLDLAATVKANEDRGISFAVPGSGEGQ